MADLVVDAVTVENGLADQLDNRGCGLVLGSLVLGEVHNVGSRATTLVLVMISRLSASSEGLVRRERVDSKP